MNQNKIDKIVSKHIWADIYMMCILLAELLVLVSQFPNHTTGWHFTFICLVLAIFICITDICYTYAKYLIHKQTLED